MQLWMAEQAEQGDTGLHLLAHIRVVSRPVIARIGLIYAAFSQAITRALYSCRPALRPVPRKSGSSDSSAQQQPQQESTGQQAAVTKAVIDSLHDVLLRAEKLPSRCAWLRAW